MTIGNVILEVPAIYVHPVVLVSMMDYDAPRVAGIGNVMKKVARATETDVVLVIGLGDARVVFHVDDRDLEIVLIIDISVDLAVDHVPVLVDRVLVLIGRALIPGDRGPVRADTTVECVLDRIAYPANGLTALMATA